MKKFRGFRKATKSQIGVLREQLSKSYNYNLFVGDKHYKTNIMLQFLQSSGQQFFEKDCFIRNKHLNTQLTATIFICSALHVVFGEESIWAIVQAAVLCAMQYFLQRQRLYPIIQILLTVTNFTYVLNQQNNPGFYLITAIQGVHLGLSWYYYVVAVSIYLVFVQPSNIIYAVTAGYLYAVLERSLKESWVIRDSFKKSFNILFKTIESIPVPVIIVTPEGNILYYNSEGEKLYNSKNESPNSSSFLSVVHQQSTIKFQELLKEALKTGQNQRMQIALLNKGVEDNDKVKTLVMRDSVEFYEMRAHRGNFKNQNCLVLTMTNEMENVIKNKILTQNTVQLSKQLHALSGKLEKYYRSYNINEIQNQQMLDICSIITSSFSVFNNFQHQHILFQYTAQQIKPELENFDVKELTFMILENLSFDFLSESVFITTTCEENLPSNVSGDYKKVKQILTTLFEFGMNKIVSGTVQLFLKFEKRLDSGDGYEISIELKMPGTVQLDFNLMTDILNQESLNKQIIFQFKDALTDDGPGLLVVGYLIKFVKGRIELNKSANHKSIKLFLPFYSQTNEHNDAQMTVSRFNFNQRCENGVYRKPNPKSPTSAVVSDEENTRPSTPVQEMIPQQKLLPNNQEEEMKLGKLQKSGSEKPLVSPRMDIETNDIGNRWIASDLQLPDANGSLQKVKTFQDVDDRQEQMDRIMSAGQLEASPSRRRQKAKLRAGFDLGRDMKKYGNSQAIDSTGTPQESSKQKRIDFESYSMRSQSRVYNVKTFKRAIKKSNDDSEFIGSNSPKKGPLLNQAPRQRSGTVGHFELSPPKNKNASHDHISKADKYTAGAQDIIEEESSDSILCKPEEDNEQNFTHVASKVMNVQEPQAEEKKEQSGRIDSMLYVSPDTIYLSEGNIETSDDRLNQNRRISIASRNIISGRQTPADQISYESHSPPQKQISASKNLPVPIPHRRSTSQMIQIATNLPSLRNYTVSPQTLAYQDQLQEVDFNASVKQWHMPKQENVKKSVKEIQENDKAYILLVEDNKFSLTTMMSQFKMAGCDVEIATDGQEAVNKFKECIKERKYFDMIMMDLIMPYMDGHEATKEIRVLEQKHKYRKTFICACSAQADGKVRTRCESEGFDDLAGKPLTMQTMKEMLAKIKQS